MATITGTVEQIRFVADLGKVLIRDESSGMEETLLLWSASNNGGGPTALFIMQLTMALAQRLRVKVVTGGTDSAFVSSVRLYAPSP
jgi:hypothetical protein